MKPCKHHKPKEGCRICWLFENDPPYRTLWGGPSAPSVRTLECIHLGDVLEKSECNCPGKWIRECDVFGLCTLQQCQTCLEYRSEPCL